MSLQLSSPAFKDGAGISHSALCSGECHNGQTRWRSGGDSNRRSSWWLPDTQDFGLFSDILQIGQRGAWPEVNHEVGRLAILIHSEVVDGG